MDSFSAKVHGKGLHLAHLNLRSMLEGHKLDVLKSQIARNDIDIFTLSETWLSEAVPNRILEPSSYVISRLDRSWVTKGGNGDIKKGGGLACFIKKGIKHQDTKYGNCNVSCEDLEMQWVAISLCKVRPIIVVNVYRPPQGNYKNCCELMISNFMKADIDDNAEIYVMGDFNINVTDHKSPAVKELNFTMRSLALTQVIKEPTRYFSHNGSMKSSVLDLIFTNSEYISQSKTLDLNLSDHLAVMVTRKKVWVKPSKIKFKGRSYKNYVKEDFRKAILKIIDPICPLRSFSVPEAKEPWITNEALEAIRDKDKLLKKAKRTGLIGHWVEAKQVRNTVGRQVENLKIDYLKKQQTAHVNDPKEFWMSIASVFPGKN